MKEKPKAAAEAEAFRCPRCGAEPGQPCHPRSGPYVGYTHVDRLRLGDAAREKEAQKKEDERP